MKFTANLAPRLLNLLEPNPLNRLESLIETAFLGTKYYGIAPEDIEVNLDGNVVHVSLTPDYGDVEIFKDILYEALLNFFDPKYNSEVEVEINDEL
jgi:hypothetical protein